MPSNNIAFARNYTSVIDEVYQRASVSGVLNSGRRIVRAGNNAKFVPAFHYLRPQHVGGTSHR